jgi:hypothetical protein
MTDADSALMLAIPKELRAELKQHGVMLLQLVDAPARSPIFGEIEGRVSDVRGEIELMLKGELLGSLTHFETQIDERLSQLSDRLSTAEQPGR